ncbi:MAG: histidine kinase [Bacteroidales bacterium]|nr:histidine kinase [Bacteroidales bacterium]
MLIQLALIVSVILQFGAFFITISLIPKTKFSIAWISISIGFLLMAFRRLGDLLLIYNTNTICLESKLSNWTAVVISITMFISSFYIRKIFDLLNRLKKLRKNNESRVLSAIISTEEKERKYFAKELHDGLGPILSSLKMSLSAIDKSNLNKFNTTIFDKAEYATDNAITVTKEISNHLNPQVLERYGIVKAITTFASNSIPEETIDLKIDSNLDKLRLKHNLETILYRIACELLNNTLKHASATVVNINLSKLQNKVIFIYEDNGIGFNLKTQNFGMGLTNIKSRVKSLNGFIEIKSSHSKGILVIIEFSL